MTKYRGVEEPIPLVLHTVLLQFCESEVLSAAASGVWGLHVQCKFCCVSPIPVYKLNILISFSVMLM